MGKRSALSAATRALKLAEKQMQQIADLDTGCDPWGYVRRVDRIAMLGVSDAREAIREIERKENKETEQGEMRELLTDARKHVLVPSNGHNYCRWCNGQRGDKGWTHDQHCYWVYMADEARKLVDRIDERLGQEGTEVER